MVSNKVLVPKLLPRKLSAKSRKKLRSKPKEKRRKLKSSSREKLNALCVKRKKPSSKKLLSVAKAKLLKTPKLFARSSARPRSSSRKRREKLSTSSTRRSVKLRELMLARTKPSRKRPVKIRRLKRSLSEPRLRRPRPSSQSNSRMPKPELKQSSWPLRNLPKSNFAHL